MQKKVLVIDDEIDILEAIKIIIETEGFEVHAVNDIKSAEEVSDYNPNLILLDFQLVGKSAKDICELLKSSDTTKDIPIIILSAHPLSKLKTLINPCHVIGYIQKPFDMNVLIEAVKNSV